MRGVGRVLAVMVALVWVLSGPLAMASDHCMGMGAMCEGPCGTPCTVPTPAMAEVRDAIMRASSPAVPYLPDPPTAVLELPPK